MNSLLLLARRTATSSLGKRILSQRVQLANQELTRRFLASEASKQNTQATSGSETDKPQWERSYKYVNTLSESFKVRFIFYCYKL